ETGAWSVTAAPGNYYLYAYPPHGRSEELGNTSEIVHAEEDVDDVVLRLLAVNVSGTVFLPGGETAVGDGFVSAVDMSFTHPQTSVDVGDDGDYFLALPAGGEWQISAEPELGNPDRLVRSLAVSDVVAPEGSVLDVDLTLRAATVEGVVHRPNDGGPSPYTAVQIFEITAPGTEDETSTPSTEVAFTDEEGTYLLALDPGTYDLVAEPGTGDGYSRSLATRVVVADTLVQQDLELRLPNVTGRVLDPDGDPIADAAVSVTTTDGDFVTGGFTSTDEDGQYALLLEPGDYLLIADDPGNDQGWQSTTVPVSVVADEPLARDLSLREPTLRGTVLDPVDGEPVEGVQVHLVVEGGSEGLETVDDSYRLTGENGVFAHDVEPGDYYVVAEPPSFDNPDGWRAVWQRVTVPVEGLLDLEITLNAPADPAYAVERVTESVIDGTALEQSSYRPSISADGSRIAFQTNAEHVYTEAGAPDNEQVYVRDAAEDDVFAAMVDPDGEQLEAAFDSYAMSDDGGSVVFSSPEVGFVGIDTGGYEQLYLRDLDDSSTTILSLDREGDPTTWDISSPTISADGDLVAFVSRDGSLATEDEDFGIASHGSANNLYLYDRSTGADELTQLTAPADVEDLSELTMSADGSTLAMFGRSDEGWRLYVLDVATDTTALVADIDVDELSFFRVRPAVTDDGGTVWFVTEDEDRSVLHAYDVDGATSTVVDPFDGLDRVTEETTYEWLAVADGSTLAFAADAGQLADGSWGLTAWAFGVGGDAPAVPVAYDEDGGLAYVEQVDIAANGAIAYGASAAPGEDHVAMQIYRAVPRELEPPTWTDGEVVATDRSSSFVELSWSGASDNVAVTQYRVYRGDTLVATVSAESTTFLATGLSAATDYTFTIQAGDAAGNWSSDGPSAVIGTLTGGDTRSSALAAQAERGGTVTLTWEPSAKPGLAGYRVFRNGTQIADVAGGTTVTFTDTGRPASTDYTYAVSTRTTSGTIEAHTVDATVTTPALAAVSGVEYTGSFVKSGVARPDPLSITVRGE
ncbi:MAG TPA: carboxypeptidase regulatory-like domain-containing protein, partial [Acidimicrobiales bacterium]|nr:carboxypeptidase regulatory-like domain-containing protein [Acidimicrobiales bacterium]